MDVYLAALLSLGGLADSIYLTVTHLTGENVACVASSGCSEVLSSAYASVGKIPLAAFGALGYFIAFSWPRWPRSVMHEPGLF